MNIQKIKYEDKPVYKEGDELYCIPEKRNVKILKVNDDRDYSDQFRPDFKDGLIYDIKMNGESYTGYHWWHFELNNK